MPVLKCPYLSQLTLQQIRAATPGILTVGAHSCPIFARFIRTSTTYAQHPGSKIRLPLNFDEIQTIHEKIHAEKPSSESKIVVTFAELENSSFRTGCEDLLCPFLKTAPIALHRVNIDQDAIEINQRSSGGFSSLADESQLFKYDRFFDAKIEAKKRDNSYRVFKRIERKSGLFPQAEAKTELDSRTITVWCSNDYLGLGQHPKLKKAVM